MAPPAWNAGPHREKRPCARPPTHPACHQNGGNGLERRPPVGTRPAGPQAAQRGPAASRTRLGTPTSGRHAARRAAGGSTRLRRIARTAWNAGLRPARGPQGRRRLNAAPPHRAHGLERRPPAGTRPAGPQAAQRGSAASRTRLGTPTSGRSAPSASGLPEPKRPPYCRTSVRKSGCLPWSAPLGVDSLRPRF